MRIFYWAIIGLILSCRTEPITNNIESRIVDELINNYYKSDSSAVLSFKQGIFSYEKINSDSIILYYSKLGFGLYTGSNCSYIDSFKISSIDQVDGLFEKTGYWNYRDFRYGRFININNLQDAFFIDSTDTNNLRFNWVKLNVKGINVLYSFSRPVLSNLKNFGMIGIQEYSSTGLIIRVVSFEIGDSLSILDRKELTFGLLGLRAEYRNDSLISIEPKGLYVK